MSCDESALSMRGDSASSTEIYALLSSLSGLPIKQYIAVTGSVNQKGEILQRHFTQAHAEQEPRVVIDVIEQVYRALLQKSQVTTADIEAVGLGFPGNVNTLTGQVLVCSNLPGWDHFPLRDVLAERLGLPVVLENDTNLCASAEHRYGAGRGTSNMCYVTFSTGYGVGIIINN